MIWDQQLNKVWLNHGVYTHRLQANKYFGIIKAPFERKRHHNQQCGLDRYIVVVNFGTGAICSKKLYKNTKGLYFKHTGYPPNYLDDFTQEVFYTPFQIANINT